MFNGPIVIISPTIYPTRREGYGGIERLCSLFLQGLVSEHPFDRNISISPEGSLLPGSTIIYCSAGAARYDFHEPGLYPMAEHIWKELTQSYDAPICFDFSHSKPTRLFSPALFIAPIWHDPYIMQPPVPSRNVACLSQWQKDRFEAAYGQRARVLDPICADSDYFIPPKERTGDEYLLFIGKLDPNKGCLEAIEAARSIKERLNIIGPVTPGDPRGYVSKVINSCDGEDIVYHGEVTEEAKLALIQGAKALLYPVKYPQGTGEAHSHKMVEVMMAGVPCIAYDQGAMREVIEDGATGYTISGRAELSNAIGRCETLDRNRCREVAVERWDYRGIVRRWLEVAEEVANGVSW